MIQPTSLGELASLVEKKMARRSFFLWRTGVAIVVISILPCQKLGEVIRVYLYSSG